MFAYCNSNPVNSCDPCGTCIHNWKLYNCEKCAAFWNRVSTTAKNAWNDVTAWSADTFYTIASTYQQQVEINIEIKREQMELIESGVEYMFNAFTESYPKKLELEDQITREQLNLARSFMESDGFDVATASGKMASGGFAVAKGIGLLAAPIPTPADDLLGVRQITFGIIKFFRGGVELLREVIDR